MPDQVPQQRRSDRVSETTSTSLTAAGMGAFLLWIFGMIDCGKFFVPPVETALFLGAGLLPIFQAIGHRWIRKIDPTAVPGVNGAAPPPPVEPAPEGAK